MAGGAKRGRKPKPHGLKVVQGTAKGDSDVVKLPEVEDLAPPEWMHHHANPKVLTYALKEWNRLAPMLNDSGVLTDGDLTILAETCIQHGEILVKYASGGQVTAADRAQLRTSYSEFGLTPASRTRVHATGKPKKANRFGALKVSA